MDKIISTIDYIYKNKDMLYKLSQDELRDISALCASIQNDDTYKDEIKKLALSILCRIVQLDVMPLQERWALFWEISRKNFLTAGYDSFAYDTLLLYRDMYDYVEKNISRELLAPIDGKSPDNTVVIVTSQFLTVRHAPTRDVVDYAYIIQEKLGFNVIIINDGGLNYPLYDYLPTKFNFMDKYNFLQSIEYNGVNFDFYQNPDKMPDVRTIENIVRMIRKLNPKLVLNVGDHCITSDLCRHFTKTATIKCGTQIPQSMADNIIVYRELHESDKARLELLDPRQQIIISHFNYVMPDEADMQHYSRTDFGLPDDAFVLTSAGNRMQYEMDDDFINAVDKILSEIPDCYFMVIGDLDDPFAIDDKFKNSDRVRLVGSLLDGSQAIRIADVYIQPRRQGGGRAAFEALYYGIPSIIPDYGDSWHVCGKTFEVFSYDEMIGKIKLYHDDKNVYEKMSELARERGLELEDMELKFRNIFNELKLGSKSNEKM